MATQVTQSAGGIIINPFGQILVVEQKKHAWSLPKGHLEGNETPREAAAREITEETGLTQFSYVTDLGSYTRYKIGKNGKDDLTEKKEIFLFLFTTNHLTLSGQDPDITNAEWVSIDTLVTKLSHPKDIAFITQHLPTLKKQLPSPPQWIEIRSTFPTKETAKTVTQLLVEKKLAACSHIIGPVESTYSWDNKIQHDSEWICEIKSTPQYYTKIEKIILSNHPYSMPQLIVTPILSGFTPYLNWMTF